MSEIKDTENDMNGHDFVNAVEDEHGGLYCANGCGTEGNDWSMYICDGRTKATLQDLPCGHEHSDAPLQDWDLKVIRESSEVVAATMPDEMIFGKFLACDLIRLVREVERGRAEGKKTIALDAADLPVLENMLMRMRFQPEQKAAATRLVAAIMIARGDDDA